MSSVAQIFQAAAGNEEDACTSKLGYAGLVVLLAAHDVVGDFGVLAVHCLSLGGRFWRAWGRVGEPWGSILEAWGSILEVAGSIW